MNPTPEIIVGLDHRPARLRRIGRTEELRYAYRGTDSDGSARLYGPLIQSGDRWVRDIRHNCGEFNVQKRHLVLDGRVEFGWAS